MVTFARESMGQTEYHAIVLPRSCSMKSLGQSGINDNILIHAFSLYGYNGVIGEMFNKTEQRVGEILKFDDGQFRIDKSALPDGYFEPDVLTPAEPLAGLPGFQGPHEDASESRYEPVEEEVKRKDDAEQKIETGFRTLASLGLANRPEDQRDVFTELPAGAGQRTRMEPRKSRYCDTGSPGAGTDEYEQSDLETDFTPSVSAASDTTTTPGLDLEGGGVVEAAAEANRNIIRDEVTLVLGRIFAGLAEQIRGNSLGG